MRTEECCVLCYLVQVCHRLRDQNGGILCSLPSVCLRHTGESSRARPTIITFRVYNKQTSSIMFGFVRLSPAQPSRLGNIVLLQMEYFSSIKSGSELEVTFSCQSPAPLSSLIQLAAIFTFDNCQQRTSFTVR